MEGDIIAHGVAHGVALDTPELITNYLGGYCLSFPSQCKFHGQDE